MWLQSTLAFPTRTASEVGAFHRKYASGCHFTESLVEVVTPELPLRPNEEPQNFAKANAIRKAVDWDKSDKSTPWDGGCWGSPIKRWTCKVNVPGPLPIRWKQKHSWGVSFYQGLVIVVPTIKIKIIFHGIWGYHQYRLASNQSIFVYLGPTELQQLPGVLRT